MCKGVKWDGTERGIVADCLHCNFAKESIVFETVVQILNIHWQTGRMMELSRSRRNIANALPMGDITEAHPNNQNQHAVAKLDS